METKKCLNCQSDLQENALFCSHCGQKNTDGKVSFWDMIKDLFDSVFNLNSKTFSTILALFIPGKLTEMYFEGKHKSYSNPVRIFLVASLAFMAIIFSFDEINFSLFDSSIQERITSKEYRIKLDTAIIITKNRINTSLTNATLDTLSNIWNKKWNTFEDSIWLNGYIPLKDTTKMAAIMDFKNLSIDEITDKYHLEGTNFLEKIYTKQVLTFLKHSDANSSFVNYLLNRFTWMLFALIPVIALLFKLFYIRHKHYYVEHLVFNFHIHAFLFFFIAFFILVQPLLNDTISTIFIIVSLIYLPIAMKRYYKQSWGKTLLKLFLLTIAYSVSLLFVVIFFLVLSFLLF